MTTDYVNKALLTSSGVFTAHTTLSIIFYTGDIYLCGGTQAEDDVQDDVHVLVCYDEHQVAYYPAEAQHH